MFFKEGGLGDIYLVPNVSNLSGLYSICIVCFSSCFQHAFCWLGL